MSFAVTRTTRTWRTIGPRLLFAVLAAAVVVTLRESGVLVGVAAIALALLCFVLAPGPRQLSDRFLLVAALCVGWLPLIGWLPGIGVRIDVPGVLLALVVGVVAAHQFHGRGTRRRTVDRPTAAEVIALSLGVLASLWWTRPFSGLTTSGIVGSLQHSGYDNVSHFSMYRSNLQLGSFVQVRPNLSDGAARLGYDYPQGLHQAWAQFTRLIQPHPSSSLSWLVHSYLHVLLLTAGGTVALGCMAVCRLCRRDVLVAVPAMAVIVSMFAVGTFMPFNGYANYELAMVAVAAAVTLMVRPTLSASWNFFAVAGLGFLPPQLYPLLVMMVPALATAAIRARNQGQGRARWAINLFILGTAVTYLMPVTIFSHRGFSWLNLPSGFATPWDLLIIVVTALIVLACVRQVSNPDLVTNVIIGGTGLLGAGALGLVAAYEVHSTGSVPYYGQKLASAVLVVCAVVLVAVIAQQVAASGARQRLPRLLAVFLAGLLTYAALQFDGYVGPSVVSPQSAYNAGGITLRDLLFQQPKVSVDAEQVLLAAQRTSGRPGHWWYLEPNPPSGISSICWLSGTGRFAATPPTKSSSSPRSPWSSRATSLQATSPIRSSRTSLIPARTTSTCLCRHGSSRQSCGKRQAGPYPDGCS